MAAAIGQPLKIPVIVRSLGQDMYRAGMNAADAVFRPALELMTYLDGNLSSNGLDDPALEVDLFLFSWWKGLHVPIGNPTHLCSATIQSALNHYRGQLAAALIPFGRPHTIRDLSDELNKPAYTWHSSVNDDLPIDCTRCRLYRAVAVGVVDQLRDTYNMVHACEVANVAEKDIAIRRASGFNELFEAALKKECEHGAVESDSGLGPGLGDEGGTKGKGKEKERFGPEVVELKKWMKKVVKDAEDNATRKWTWGVDLTDEDLHRLIRGADSQYQVPHSGYDQDLSTGSLRSQTSEALDPAHLEELSGPINIIPELRSPEIPTYSFVLLGPSGEPIAESEPDPAIEAFAKRARTKKKLLMQDEVDQPAGYLDYETPFRSQNALIPRRPWLGPRLPIILPPSNIVHVATDHAKTSESVHTDPDTDDKYPDHIDIPDSDSSTTSQIRFPVSDSDSNEMDVVRSDGQAAEPHGAESDTNIYTTLGHTDSASDTSIIDHIILPDDFSRSEDPLLSSGGSGVMAGFQRDPNTGRFTAASFAHFPDDLVD